MNGYIGTPLLTSSVTNLGNNTLTTSGWTTGSNTSLSIIDNNYFCVTYNGTSNLSATRYAYKNLISSITANSTNPPKIYFRVLMRGDKNNSRTGAYSYPKLYYRTSSSNILITDTDVNGLTGASLKSDEWHTMSGIVSASSNNIVSISLAFYYPGANDKIYFKDIMVVNLTDTFGQGSEPTLQECNDNFIFEDSNTIKYLNGDQGKARHITNLYVGINGKARKAAAAYIGVNGKARLWYSAPKSFSEIFQSLDGFEIWPQTSTSAVKYPQENMATTYPTAFNGMITPQEGQVWFTFYCLETSIEINKVILTGETTMTSERIRGPSTERYYTDLVNSTKHVGHTSSYGANMVYLHFSISPSIIEKKFKEGTISMLAGAQYNTATTDTISFTFPSTGIVMPIFSHYASSWTGNYSKYGLFGFLNAASGATSNTIKGGSYYRDVNNNETTAFLSSSKLLSQTYSSRYNLYNPLTNSTAASFGYSIVHFQD